MNSARHRNTTYGFIAGLEELLATGYKLEVRGSMITELRNHVTIIDKPLERCIITPKRNNNIFAAIAETVWVMAGRNDLAYLGHYLPRATDFSDDGKTWRAAYGPRLRNWYGVDQFQKIVQLFGKELNTRRAVMAIFDPAVDYQDSKDIPCNNWLDWLVRDGRLHLSIALRSNDAVWGFSGINSFEWSVLQEMLAYWIGVGVGDATFFATSFHMYEHHDKRAAAMAAAFQDTTWYSVGDASPSFATSWEHFDAMLAEWFTVESLLRTAPDKADIEVSQFSDPLFRQFLVMLQLYNGLMKEWSDAQVADYLSRMPENDLTAAAYEYLSRHRPAVIDLTAGHDTVKRWLNDFNSADTGNHASKRTKKEDQ